MFIEPAIRNPIAISLGAIAGALCRYYLTLLFAKIFGAGFPYGTFFINVTGCVAMGFFMTLFVERFPGVPVEVRLLVTTGFLGAYTTFSTYGLEGFVLINSRRFFEAGCYLMGSVVLGFLGVYLGAFLARLWV